MKCVSITSLNKIQFNLYLNKTSANTREIKGNITNLIPVDDSLTMEFNVAIKDSIGHWWLEGECFYIKDNKSLLITKDNNLTKDTMVARLPIFDHSTERRRRFL
ncbi:unnamed protein product [Macrosiphum euphorbiae]|uniref:Uncharacterized protein n=1 Tax=Macrosiphum euphorbiae TaxID=13131 RepID=A0AAV0XJT2_9HEMI|nr:unnamed protein product [Macrosiphum euphorbiae]